MHFKMYSLLVRSGEREMHAPEFGSKDKQRRLRNVTRSRGGSTDAREREQKGYMSKDPPGIQAWCNLSQTLSVLEFFSPFLWRAPPLEMRPER